MKTISVHAVFEPTGDRCLLRKGERLIPLEKGERLVIFLEAETDYHVDEGMAFLSWPGRSPAEPWSSCSIEAGCEVTLKPPADGRLSPDVSRSELPHRDISLTD